MVIFNAQLCQLVPTRLRWGALVASSLALGLAVCATQPASACSYAYPTGYFGAPADGETNVPTDVVLSVSWGNLVRSFGEEALEQLDITLAAEGEEPIGVTVERPYLGYLALAPERELEPNTRYQLTLAVPDADPIGMEFTTAEGPLEEAPPAPSATLEAFRMVDYVPSTCNLPAAGSCLAIPDDTWVQVRTLDAQGEPNAVSPTYLVRGAHFARNPNDANCLELRTRALNGVLSEAAASCFDVAPLYELRDLSYPLCTAAYGLVRPLPPPGIGPDEAVVVPDPEAMDLDPEEGCSVSGAPRGARGFSWSLLALVGLGGLRLRGRRPRQVLADQGRYPSTTAG